MKLILPMLLSISLSMGGCATMFNGSDAAVRIVSEDKDAKIYVDGMYVGKGEATAVINKKGSHFITAKKDNCGDASTPVRKSFDPVSLLGLLIDFGIISMLFVDGLGTGAIQDISPKQYSVTPQCS